MKKTINLIFIILLIVFSCDDRQVEIEQSIAFDFFIDIDEEFLELGKRYPINLEINFEKEISRFQLDLFYSFESGSGNLFKNGVLFDGGTIDQDDKFEIQVNSKESVELMIRLFDKFNNTSSKTISASIKDNNVLFDFSINLNIEKDSIRFSENLDIELNIFEFGENYDIDYSVKYLIDNELGELFFNNNKVIVGESIEVSSLNNKFIFVPFNNSDINEEVKLDFQVENDFGLSYRDNVKFKVYGNIAPVFSLFSSSISVGSQLGNGNMPMNIFPAGFIDGNPVGSSPIINYVDYNINYSGEYFYEDQDGSVDNMIIRLINNDDNETTIFNQRPTNNINFKVGVLREYETYRIKKMYCTKVFSKDYSYDYNLDKKYSVQVTDNDNKSSRYDFDFDNNLVSEEFKGPSFDVVASEIEFSIYPGYYYYYADASIDITFSNINSENPVTGYAVVNKVSGIDNFQYVSSFNNNKVSVELLDFSFVTLAGGVVTAFDKHLKVGNNEFEIYLWDKNCNLSKKTIIVNVPSNLRI